MIADDRLRLLFTCCHPALNRPVQVALALRTLGGLTTREVARAFVEPEATTAQRLVRAKTKIRDARIPYEVPDQNDLPMRLAAVLEIVYLVFNEGYASTAAESFLRPDLCREAVRLGRLIVELLPDHPETHGLLALMLLHDARRPARVVDGEMIPLEDQDRGLWDREFDSRGDGGARSGVAVSPAGPVPDSGGGGGAALRGGSRGRDRLAADRGALWGLAASRPHAGGRAECSSRGGDGGAARGWARLDRGDRGTRRTERLSPAPRGEGGSACGGRGGGRRRRRNIARRWIWSHHPRSGGICSGG